MNEDVTVMLVHGFWGGAAHWAHVITELSNRGYDKIRAIELPLTSLAHDAERARKMIAQQEGNVLLVGHSYGGAVITEVGDLPNVVGLVYIAAFAPDAGESAGAISEQSPPAAVANIAPDSDGYLWIAYDKYHESFCQDLNANDALVMSITQKAPLGAAFGDTVTAPAWKTKPSWYQISSEDRMINPESQKQMAERIAPRKTITLAASHASLASKASQVAELIDEAAKTVG